MRTRMALMAAVVMAMSALACSSSDSDDDGVCSSDGDCKGDRVCSAGACVAPSTNDSRDGDSCSSTQCGSSSQLLYCRNGRYESYSCGTLCADEGFTSKGCYDDMCQCGQATDTTCANGVTAFCVCAEWAGESCSNDDELSFYDTCHEGGSNASVFKCMGSRVSNNKIDCASAIDACM